MQGGHLVAGDGQGRRLEVQDVDAHAHQARDQRTVDHAGGLRAVAADRDRGARGQGRAEGRAQLDRELGDDLDVDQARDARGAEQGALRARAPDEAAAHGRAGLDGLVGPHLDVGLDQGTLAHDAVVGDDGALLQLGAALDGGVLADHAAAQLDVLADVGVVPEHGALEARVRLDDHVVADDGAGAQRHALGDLAVVTDDQRPVELGARVDDGALADVDAGLALGVGHVDLDLALEDVVVRFAVGLEVAHVLPVAARDVPVHGVVAAQQEGEEVLGEVHFLLGLEQAQDLGLEDVGAGVDGVGEDLAGAGLLEEALDAALFVGDDDAELERVLDPVQEQGREGLLLLVVGDRRRQVDVGKAVARDHQEGVVQVLLDGLDRPRRAEGHLLLDRVGDVDPEVAAVPEVVLDDLRQVVEGDEDVGDPMPLEEVDDVLRHGAVQHRDHGLGNVAGERAQAGTGTAGHQNSLHRELLTPS
ncbi:hypothetical protein D3C86_1105790 [compost metagenome]